MSPSDPPGPIRSTDGLPDTVGGGPTDLFTAFREGVARHPGREFVVHRSARLTWAQGLDLVERCAAAFAHAGVRAGDRVVLLGPTRPEAVVVLLACARLGAIYVALGPRVQRGDIDYVCADTRPSLLLAMADPALGDRTGDLVSAAARLGLPHPLVLSCTDDGSPSPEFLEVLGGAGSPPDGTAATGSTPLTIVYTSGTTGDPKGVVLSHRSLLNYRNLVARNALEAPRLLSDMPIDHIGFIGNEVAAAVLTGGTLVQVPRFDAVEVLEALQREGVTAWLGAIPTMLNRLVALEEFATADLSRLEFVWWVGPLPERTAAALVRHGIEVGASYGLSEACCLTMTDRGVATSTALGTVGRPLDDVELRFAELPGDGGDGEIQVRRVGLMSEYWGKPEATAAAIDRDGWLSTGDLGHLDGDGNLVVTGRLKLLIRSGGYNLSPYEIETALESHPDVTMAVVVGVPDAEYGESAHAAWMPAPGADVTDDDLRRFLRERLSGFKVPKRFHRVDHLPLLANGKADRRGIRHRIEAAVREHAGNQEPADVRR